MTEDWAPAQLTDEEEAEYQEEQDSATEDEPAQLNPNSHEDQDDPPQIDRRSTAERLSEEEEPEKEPEATTKEESKPGKTVKTDTSATTETQPEDDWWEKMSPEEQKKNAQGLYAEVKNLRETRREVRENLKEEQEESDRRIQKMMEDKFAKLNKDSEPPAEVPDPEYDPEGYADHLRAREEALAEREKVITDQQELSEADQKINSTVMRQEQAFNAEQPDYFQTIQQGRAAAVNQLKTQYEQARIPDAESLAQARVDEYMGGKMREIIAQGGDVAAWAYQEAKTYIQPANGAADEVKQPAAPAKPSGESTAAAITAGEKAAKGLGKGGGTSVGELTPEDISHLKGEEFDKAYEAWENKQLGKSPDWTPT